MVVRLRALAKLLNYAYHHGASVVVFEDLDKIKRRRFTTSPVANRRIAGSRRESSWSTRLSWL